MEVDKEILSIGHRNRKQTNRRGHQMAENHLGNRTGGSEGVSEKEWKPLIAALFDYLENLYGYYEAKELYPR